MGAGLHKVYNVNQGLALEHPLPMLLQASQVTFGWNGGAPVLQGLDWSLPAGGFVGLLGPNGCGKSTLLHLLDGLASPDSGQVLLDGKDLSRMTPRVRARQVALVAQDALVPFSFSVREVVEMGRYPWHGRFSSLRPAEYALVDEALARLDLQPLAGRSVRELSGGERQRVAIARALVQTPRVLLLDEPTSHLDIKHVADVVQLLHELNTDPGVTVLMVLHDLALAAAVCPRVALMDRAGKLVAEGEPGDVLTPDALQAVYGLPVAAEMVGGRTVVLPEWTRATADADDQPPGALQATWREATT